MKTNRIVTLFGLLLLTGAVLNLPVGNGQTSLPPYTNPSLPIEERVNDLVSRMTLEEKVSQMMNAAPAIERLDIPAYEWWNEALHGVARAGYATVFPQAIGMAATWDTDLIHQVADVISTEARAKHHEFIRHNQHARYEGLTFWSPNINIFRDPRWGRGQETYGEDPFLTSRLGVAFVKGLQGDDPRYFKVIATPKHYAVHSGPEPQRHSFDATAYERDLRETYLPAFRAAVKDGLISEAEIDVAVKRLMTARFRLGMFDPPEAVPYSRIPFSENDSEAHRALALKAARESMVLLKNENNTLPLQKDLKTVAVIGPNADALEVLLGNYNGTPSRYVTPLAGIKSKISAATQVLYSPGAYKIGVSALSIPPSSLTVSGAGSADGLKGEYFDNREMKGKPILVRTDAELNFDWGAFSPAPALTPQNYSVRWTGKLTAPVSGKYLLGAAGNGGLRVFVDGKLLIEDFVNRKTKTITKEINLESGRAYDIRVDYVAGQNTVAAAKLIWSPPNGEQTLRDDAISKARQADVVVMCLGLSPLVEGEEMDVPFEGFRGGDRIDIALPKVQEQLLEEVTALGKPTVVVLLNGSALAVNWANDHAAAIVDAWYPGEEGGAALADVLFGDYNPAGRLPVTFYKSIDQLPPFTDYNMQGRTYRYFKGEPLYAFGFGLSYTKFKYDKLKLSAAKLKAGAELKITTEVQNVGDRAGDEVVQLYLSDVAAPVPVPIRSLAGMQRVFLKPGEKQNVSFTLSPTQMSLIDDNGKRVIEPGEFLVSVGGKQPGVTGYADAKTTAIVTAHFFVTGKVIAIP